MKFPWDAAQAAWFLDASAYTGFHEKLAAVIRPYLHKTDKVLDMGCGLGLLDIALHQSVASITAIDVNENAIGHLAARVKAAGIKNVHPLCTDVWAHEERYDATLMSFFGYSHTLSTHIRHRVTGRLIRIVNSQNAGSLYPAHYRRAKKTTVANFEEELRGASLPYELKRCTLEFGQPLRSEADALAFVKMHAPGAPEAELSAFLAARLQCTGGGEFPLYLPQQKDLGIFVVYFNE